MPARNERVPRRRVSDTKTRRGQASARTPEREPVRERKREPARKRDSASRREPARERKREPVRGRKRVRRTPERERVARRGRVSERSRTTRRKAPPRRRRRPAPGSFLSLLPRVAIALAIFFALGRIGNGLVFQELQVNHPDRDAPAEETPPAPVDKGTAAVATAVPDIAAAAPVGAADSERKEGFYTVLLAGTDDYNGGSDTIILMGVDSKNNKIFGVSVPRDTKAIVNGKPYKMNAAYKIGGTRLLADTISEQMSIPVDYTAEVNLEGFAALIDAMGGVDFEVPIDMDYEDPAQNLEIHISKGLQHLNGASALKVVRFRHNSDGTGYGDEDLGRIRTQQKFLKTAAKKLLSFSSLTKVNDFIRIFQKYVKTDLTLPNLAWLAKEAISAGSDGIQFATLPGTWKNPYIYTNQEEALALINEHLNPYKEDRTLADLNFPS
ncbi:MAG: LCP family protein [Oscillospiraceae bacterium]|nr:LCP family protein [Oscillospiraceae bacterium]